MKIRLWILSAILSFSGLAFAADKPLILSSSNVLVLSTEVNSESVAKIMIEARKLDTSASRFMAPAPLYLFLDTPGGSITDGLKLIDFLKGLKRPVHTITSFAASMGFQIAEQLETRYILPHGILMSHRARGEISGEFGGVSPNQMESRYALWSKIVAELDVATVKRTKGKQTLASYEQKYVPELWLTAGQSIEGGFADVITTARCDSSLDGTEAHEINFMGFKITYDTDKCPLNGGILNAKLSLSTNQGVMPYDDFVAKGGAFSAECLVLAATDNKRLCSNDTTLSHDKVKEVTGRFIDTFNAAKINVKAL